MKQGMNHYCISKDTTESRVHPFVALAVQICFRKKQKLQDSFCLGK